MIITVRDLPLKSPTTIETIECARKHWLEVLPVLTAYATQNAPIQYRRRGSDNAWVDAETPQWRRNREYRIKPTKVTRWVNYYPHTNDLRICTTYPTELGAKVEVLSQYGKAQQIAIEVEVPWSPT